MKKHGFTLSEVLIVVVIIGLVLAILMPAIRRIIPDRDEAKVKKAYNTLSNVVQELLDDNDLYGQTLGKKANDSNADATYFCQQFADRVNVSGVISCSSSTGVSNQTVTAASDLDGRCATKKKAFKTSDGIIWYGMYNNFSDTSKYVVVCIDTDTSNANAKYGFGVRPDGRIIIGTKAQAILDKEGQ